MSTKIVIACLCLSSGIAVNARIVYVTPSGGGDKDGTSWANAYASITKAYADAAEDASEEAPGEVWIRYGAYKCTKVVIQPNVIVRGGFAGSETMADEAKPETNPTILHDDTFNIAECWDDGSRIWTEENGKYIFHDPPMEGDREVYRTFGMEKETYGFQRYDGHLVGVVEFHGLTFTRYGKSAIRMKCMNPRSLVLDKCRFLNLGWRMYNDYFALQLIGIGVDMTDCEFVGTASPAYLATAQNNSPHRTNHIQRCRFFSNQGTWSTDSSATTERLVCSGGIGARRNVTLVISGCTFDRCICENATSGGGTLSFNCSGDVTIEDTVVTRGYGTGDSCGGVVCHDPLSNNSRLTIQRSRFEHCANPDSPTLLLRGSSNRTSHPLLLSDAFISSSLSSDYPLTAVNCLFESSVFAPTSHLAFINCVFSNTSLANTTPSRLSFVNTLFANASTLPANAPFSFANCATSQPYDFHSSDPACYRIGPLLSAMELGLESAPRTNGAVVARRLSSTSHLRRMGRPVWRASEDGYYFYDDTSSAAAREKPWVACMAEDETSVVRLSPSEADAIGLSTAHEPLTDAFGVSRGDKSALGCLNAPVQGLRVTFGR